MFPNLPCTSATAILTTSNAICDRANVGYGGAGGLQDDDHQREQQYSKGSERIYTAAFWRRRERGAVDLRIVG